MDQKDLKNILHKLAGDKASESERITFYSWLDSLGERTYQEVLDQYQQVILQRKERGNPLPELEKRIEHRINQLPTPGKAVSLTLWKELAVVAAILLLTVAGTWYTLAVVFSSGMDSPPQEMITSRFGDDILPGSEKATLTLSSGQTIVLDDLSEGQMNLDNGIQITKTGQGRMSYKFSGDQGSGSVHSNYNTISTPKGGEYQVTLPDGSRVWLNSMSSLTAPSVFDEKKRMVHVTGEVYFEVAQRRSASGDKIPFLVQTANQTIEVLGTQFNIKAYPEQKAIETTLVEGKVKVKTSGSTTRLSPGEQSKVEADGHIQHFKEVNIGKIVAWKNGYFQFDDDSIQDIMKQLTRWYNIEVEYPNNIPESGFGGQISRSKNISEVLRILELTDEIHFKIEGRKVSVWKK